MTSLTAVFGWLDLLTMCVFVSFICYFRFITIAKAQALEAEHKVSVSDFAVEIEGLPRKIKDHARYEALLRSHLEERLAASNEVDVTSRICDISVVRDRNKRLGMKLSCFAHTL